MVIEKGEKWRFRACFSHKVFQSLFTLGLKALDCFENNKESKRQMRFSYVFGHVSLNTLASLKIKVMFNKASVPLESFATLLTATVFCTV